MGSINRETYLKTLMRISSQWQADLKIVLSVSPRPMLLFPCPVP